MTDASKSSTLLDTARECEPRKQDKAGVSEQPLLLNSPKSTTVHIDSTTAPRSVGETASLTASVATSSSTATKKEETEAAAANHFYVLTQLARQLEYYFCTQNLSKDTYVQTLRSLNDGCVPVSILANFSKVKLLLRGVTEEEERVHAVLQASTEHSEGLRVVSIDTGSGKIVTDETPSGANTILAIGTHDNEPLQQATITTVTSSAMTLSPMTTPVLPPPSPGSSTNTLILRDVIQQVTEEEIRALFTFEGCPPVESILQDVANCWFVRLDTEDRFVMMNTMMRVQAQTLAGYPVHARLKASATSTVPIDTAPPMPLSCWVPDANDLDAPTPATATTTTKSKSSRKKSRRSRKGRRKNKNNNSTEKKDSTESNDDKSSSSSDKSVTTAPEAPKSPSVNPPSLDEDNFPTLQEKKVEWETISEEDNTSSKGDLDEDDKDRQDNDEDDEEERSEERVVDRVEEVYAPRSSLSSFSKATFSSDGASTATTTSSSTDSFPKKTLVMPVGGYAAALMMAPPVKPVVPKATTGTVSEKSNPQEQRQDRFSANKSEDDIAAAAAAAGPPPMVVQPPTWGQGRSFADILRKD